MRSKFFLFAILPFLFLTLSSCSDDPSSPTGPGNPIITTTGGCDDAAWRQMESGTTEWLWGAWGSSDTDVHTVGARGVALLFPGSRWQQLPTGTQEVLCDVWVDGKGAGFAVGFNGIILRLDGDEWKSVDSGTTVDLYGVWGASASDVFVVGARGLILHYDGNDWQKIDSGTSLDFFGVWGTRGDDVFAVGVSGMVLHFNGNDWSMQVIDEVENFTGVYGFSSTNVYVVGDLGRLYRYNGSSWMALSSGTDANLFGIWGSAANDIFVVGARGMILHYDGSGWSFMVSDTSKDLFDVWGSSACNVFAVGMDGTIIRYSRVVSELRCDASADPTTGAAPLTVQFTASATGGESPYSFRWEFGDGDSSDLQNPVHTYNEAGQRQATLTVTDGRQETCTSMVTITITSGDVCDGAKLRALRMKYTGDGCEATNHNQDPNKVSCSGDPMDAMMVRIVATDKEDPEDSKAKVWFDGVVKLNQEFEIDAMNAGEDKLKASTYVTIFDMDGEVLQTIKFHTSCSQPLSLGDQFGSLLLTGFTPED